MHQSLKIETWNQSSGVCLSARFLCLDQKNNKKTNLQHPIELNSVALKNIHFWTMELKIFRVVIDVGMAC